MARPRTGQMSKLFAKEKPSKTAFRAAWMRAWANKDFQNQIWGPDFLAEYFLPFFIRLLVKSEKSRNIGKVLGDPYCVTGTCTIDSGVASTISNYCLCLIDGYALVIHPSPNIDGVTWTCSINSGLDGGMVNMTF